MHWIVTACLWQLNLCCTTTFHTASLFFLDLPSSKAFYDLSDCMITSVGYSWELSVHISLFSVSTLFSLLCQNIFLWNIHMQLPFTFLLSLTSNDFLAFFLFHNSRHGQIYWWENLKCLTWWPHRSNTMTHPSYMITKDTSLHCSVQL